MLRQCFGTLISTNSSIKTSLPRKLFSSIPTQVLASLKELEEATELIRPFIPPTPQIQWPLLCHRLGTTVWTKHENHTRVGAFKVRGGIVYMNALKNQYPTKKKVICATRGNHGQSIAFASRLYGFHSIVVVPRGNSTEKNAAMQALGAELIIHGEDFQSSFEYATKRSQEEDLLMIPSFDPLLVRGVGTYGLEFLKEVPDLDVVYVPIGQGSGICGIISARNALNLSKLKIVGVVSEKAPAYALSFRAGKAISHPVSTRIADGMACRETHPLALPVLEQNLEKIITVSDEEVEEAMRILFADTHNLAEGAGAASLAAVLKEKHSLKGRKVGFVLSGSNVDLPVFNRVLSSN